jgi:hypothetical protein
VATPQPTLSGYLAFLYGTVGIKPGNLPSVSGTATGGSQTTLIDTTQTWEDDEWAGYVVTDLTQNAQAEIASNTATTLTFVAALTNAVAAGDSYLVTPESVVLTLAVALDTVNLVLALASPLYYTLAVYNLAADRLFNFAPDVPGQSFFVDTRDKLRLLEVSVGVTTAASDQGTAGTLLNPEQMKLLTLQDLQTLKTPYGRTYMGIAQKYGRTIWGRS